jgi:hypothetical protein
LRHVGEDVEQGLAVKHIVGEDLVGLSRGSEWVACEQNVQQTNTHRPDISLGRRVARIRGIVLLGGHVAVATDARLVAPRFLGSQAKVPELHRTILCEEDILRLDVTVIQAIGMHEVHSAQELQHEITNVLGLQRTTIKANGFVKIAIGTVFQNEVCVMLGVKSVDQVDQIRVEAEAPVALKLFEPILGLRALEQTFDSNFFASLGISGKEHHSERPMVQRGQGSESAVQQLTLDEVVLQALHGRHVGLINAKSWDEKRRNEVMLQR